MSGYLFPIILINYSLNNFTNYHFNIDYGNNKLRGFGNLPYIIFSVLLLLSTLITKYYIYLFSKINNSSFIFLNFDSLQVIFILIFSVLLLINATKKVIKKLYLIFYFLIFSIYWTIKSYPIDFYIPYISKDYLNKFLSHNIDFNFINILYLFSLDVLFFIWSYISYRNNLSDWYIPFPQKKNFNPLINIFLFYFGMIVYYYIFRNL